MIKSFKLTYQDKIITTPDGSSPISTDLSGTYTDVLFISDAAAGAGVHSGELAHSIYDYDMIKIYPRSVSSECGIQTMYCPKDIPASGMNHVYTVFGGGNIYLSDTVINWTDGRTFSAYAINGGTYAGARQVTNSVSGVTTKFERYSSYSEDNARIHMIVGTKYYGNRDLLYSANSSAISFPQTINLSSPFTDYDRLQIKVKYRYQSSDPSNDREIAGYWTEYHGYVTSAACKLIFIGGNGGAYYTYSMFGGWDNATTLKINGGKPLVWSVTSNDAVTQTPNNSGNYYVSEVWGIK